MDIAKLLRLDRIGADGQTAIHLRICWQGNKVRLSSGEKVKPDEWDSAKQKVKSRVKFSADINSRLETYESSLRKFYYAQTNVGTAVTEAMIRSEVERIREEELGQAKPQKKTAQQPGLPSLVDFLTDYEKQLPSGRSSSARQIRAIRLHMDAFQPGIDWASLRINTLNQIKNYWADEIGLSDNSISTYFGTLRAALKFAAIQGYPVPPDYTLISGSLNDVVRPILTRQHLHRLGELDLSKSAEMYRINWLFMMACYTGLRRSDLRQVRASSIRTVENHPCLFVVQQKTAKSVAIPLMQPAIELLDRHPDGFPDYSPYTYNRILKRIAVIAGFTEPVTVSSSYNGKMIHQVVPLHDTIASHTARRTFASLMIEGGLNIRVLQQLMGHETISSTEKYVHLPSSVVVSQTLDAWGKMKQS